MPRSLPAKGGFLLNYQPGHALLGARREQGGRSPAAELVPSLSHCGSSPFCVGDLGQGWGEAGRAATLLSHRFAPRPSKAQGPKPLISLIVLGAVPHLSAEGGS